MTVFVNRKMFVFPSDNNESTSNSQMLIKSSKAKSPGKCSKEKTNPIKHEIIRQLNSSNETTVSERIHDNAPSSAEMLRHLDEHLKSRKNLQTEKTGTKEMKNPNNMFNQVMVTKVKKEAFKAWHIQWRETHYSACSALKKHLKKYALEPDWNQMSFNDISQINAFDRYLNTLKFRMEPPQTSLLIKIFKNEKDIVEQIKSGNQDVIDDMREQYWFFYKER